MIKAAKQERSKEVIKIYEETIISILGYFDEKSLPKGMDFTAEEGEWHQFTDILDGITQFTERICIEQAANLLPVIRGLTHRLFIHAFKNKNHYVFKKLMRLQSNFYHFSHQPNIQDEIRKQLFRDLYVIFVSLVIYTIIPKILDQTISIDERNESFDFLEHVFKKLISLAKSSIDNGSIGEFKQFVDVVKKVDEKKRRYETDLKFRIKKPKTIDRDESNDEPPVCFESIRSGLMLIAELKWLFAFGLSSWILKGITSGDKERKNITKNITELLKAVCQIQYTN